MGSCSSTLTVSPRKLRASIKRRAAGRRLVKVRKTHSLKKEEKAFLRSNPTFENTAVLDRLRTIEYPTLDKEGHIYLDYTGGGLYAESQLRTHYDLLRRSVFGNPHSLSPTSSAITELDERARDLVLTYFNASPDEYTVVFTANASNALKLLGESYPFGPGGEMLLLWDNHNSVHGIREFARRKGAKSTYIPVTLPELRADEAVVEAALDSPGEKSDVPRLFAYPAQSNFSGTQHPLEWIEKAQSRGWDVLLDAAAFVPTNRLDLAHWKPDFVPVSFYKMFGYPSGVGCLIARKDTLARLSRPWFAGGTVWGVTVQSQGHVLLEGNSGFEDGTINYLSLPAVEIGLHHISRLGIDTIHERVLCLTNWLLKTLEPIRHSNGLPVVIVYGPPDTTRRGGTISFNFIDPTGRVIDERIVEQRAASIHLSLRTGCFCNPGAGEAAFRLTQEMLLRAFNEAERSELEFGVKKQWDDFLSDMGMPTGGAIRISLGLMSNFADVYRFVQFACSFIDNIPKERDLVPRLHC